MPPEIRLFLIQFLASCFHNFNAFHRIPITTPLCLSVIDVRIFVIKQLSDELWDFSGENRSTKSSLHYPGILEVNSPTFHLSADPVGVNMGVGVGVGVCSVHCQR